MHSLLHTLIQAQRQIVKGVQLFLVLEMPLVLQVMRLAEVRFANLRAIRHFSLHRSLHLSDSLERYLGDPPVSRSSQVLTPIEVPFGLNDLF